jgi:hypothetical protein
MGDLAARVLGDGLINWLWALGDAPDDAQAFAKQVEGALEALTEQGKHIVAAYELPATLPPIVKQALEMQRGYGSESMFVAGRIALARNFIVVAWLGDSPVAAIDFNGELVDLGPHGSTAERWNATTGVKGSVHAWVGKADQVARVAGYTDGLATGNVPTDDDLAKLVERWKTDPPADDASLIDVRLAPSPETTGKDDPDGMDKVEALVGPPPAEDDTRPIPLPPARNPVAGVSKIEPGDERTKPPEPVKPGPPRAITPKGEPVKKETILGQPPPDHKRTAQDATATLEQIRAWQQTAREKLISAKLALDQIERLLGDDTQTSE